MKLDDQRRSPEAVERASLEERLCAMRLDAAAPDGPPEPEGPCPALLCGTAVRWVPRAPDLDVAPRRSEARAREPESNSRDTSTVAIGAVIGSYRVLEHLRSDRGGRIALVECVDCKAQRSHRMTILRTRPACKACWKTGGQHGRPGGRAA